MCVEFCMHSDKMDAWMWIASATALATFISILPEPKKIFGIYSQPGKYYYLKAAFIYISIKLRKLQSMRNKTSETDTPHMKTLTKTDDKLSCS